MSEVLEIIFQWQICHSALHLKGSWWQEHAQLPYYPLGMYVFSAKATSLFFPQYFSISSCITSFNNHCSAELTCEFGIQDLFSGLYISSPTNLIIKIGKNNKKKTVEAWEWDTFSSYFHHIPVISMISLGAERNGFSLLGHSRSNFLALWYPSMCALVQLHLYVS